MAKLIIDSEDYMALEIVAGGAQKMVVAEDTWTTGESIKVKVSRREVENFIKHTYKNTQSHHKGQHIEHIDWVD